MRICRMLEQVTSPQSLSANGWRKLEEWILCERSGRQFGYERQLCYAASPTPLCPYGPTPRSAPRMLRRPGGPIIGIFGLSTGRRVSTAPR